VLLTPTPGLSSGIKPSTIGVQAQPGLYIVGVVGQNNNTIDDETGRLYPSPYAATVAA